jgi:hypothetical protein
MTKPLEDISMKPHRAAGTNLATREIALALAEMILKHAYGEEDFRMQLPLRVSETSDRWVIEGSRTYDYSKAVNNLVAGKVEIEILKANCQIVKLIQKTDFAVP